MNQNSQDNLNTVESKVLLQHNMSSENMKSQEIRNEENKFRREKNLQKVTIEKREKLFKYL
jgi:protein subunit release factor B